MLVTAIVAAMQSGGKTTSEVIKRIVRTSRYTAVGLSITFWLSVGYKPGRESLFFLLPVALHWIHIISAPGVLNPLIFWDDNITNRP